MAPRKTSNLRLKSWCGSLKKLEEDFIPYWDSAFKNLGICFAGNYGLGYRDGDGRLGLIRFTFNELEQDQGAGMGCEFSDGSGWGFDDVDAVYWRREKLRCFD